jgi:Tfp pilus assembly protein PilF
MLAPETDAYAPVARFAIPHGERTLAIVAAALLASAVVVGLLAWGSSGPLRPVVLVAAGLGALILLARGMRAECVEIDFQSRSYSRESGLPPFTRRRSAPLADGADILYRVEERPSAVDGVPESVYSAWLRSGAQTVPLASGWPSPNGREFLALLADRLNGALEQPDFDGATGGRRFNVGAALMWAGILTVFAVMAWPVLSGQRPLRAAWAGVFSPAPSRGTAQLALFNQGRQFYQQGDFREAESLFAQAVSAGYDRANGYNMLAYAQAGQKRLDDALKTARLALSFAPASGIILDTVGEMHELKGEFKPAEEYYRKALARLGGAVPVETRAKLGRTLLALGKREEALDHIRWAAQYKDRPGQPYARVAADILESLGESPSAAALPVLPNRRMGAAD